MQLRLRYFQISELRESFGCHLWTDLFSMEIHQLSGVTRNNEFYNPTRQSPSWGALKNEREMFEYLRQKMYPLISHI